MKRRRFNQLIGALILSHLTIALLFIFNPEFLSSQRMAQLYKWYLIPGPFFYDEAISHIDYVLVSWKMNDRWSDPINPTSKNFGDFLTGGNPSLMYQTRLESSMLISYMRYLDLPGDSKREEKLGLLKRYYTDHYVPPERDSTRLIFVRKTTGSFSTQLDTLCNVTF